MLNIQEVLLDMWNVATEKGAFAQMNVQYVLSWTKEECLALAPRCEEILDGIERLAKGEAPEGILQEIWKEYLSSSLKEDMYLTAVRDMVEKYGENWKEWMDGEEADALSKSLANVPEDSFARAPDAYRKVKLIRWAKHLQKLIGMNAPELILNADRRLFTQSFAIYHYGRVRKW